MKGLKCQIYSEWGVEKSKQRAGPICEEMQTT
jgi:hypothetical protein